MEIKTWLLIIRILNFLCSGMLIGFEIWFIVELIVSDTGIYGVMIQIFAPIFIMYFLIIM